MTTDSHVRLRVLEKDDLAKMDEKTPGLESKINDYCLKLEPVSNLLKTKKLERRSSKRLNMPARVLVQIKKDQDRQEQKPFIGELINISGSGLAFIIKTTPDFARLLLGGELDMTLTFEELESDLEMNLIGFVVAVSKEPFNEYIVHAKFSKALETTDIDDLEDLTLTYEEKKRLQDSISA